MKKIEFEVNGVKHWYYQEEWVRSVEWHKWLEKYMFRQDKEWDKFEIWFKEYYATNFPE